MNITYVLNMSNITMIKTLIQLIESFYSYNLLIKFDEKRNVQIMKLTLWEPTCYPLSNLEVVNGPCWPTGPWAWHGTARICTNTWHGNARPFVWAQHKYRPIRGPSCRPTRHTKI